MAQERSRCDDGDVVDEGAEEQFQTLGGCAAAAQESTETALALTEAALHLPALAIPLPGKSLGHFLSVFPPGRTRARTADPGRKHARGLQYLPHEPVVRLGVVSPVAQDLLKGMNSKGLRDGREELAVVRAGSLIRHGRQPQMAVGLTYYRQLGVAEISFSTPSAIILAPVPGLVTGGVDGDLSSMGWKLISSSGNLEKACQQSRKAPFFSSR